MLDRRDWTDCVPATPDTNGKQGRIARSANSRISLGDRTMTKRTSLCIPAGTSIDAWRRLGRQIFVISDSSVWWLGDWLVYGQTQFPDRYKRAIAETSLDYQTLRNYAWVSRHVSPSQRREKLSFQHHAEVAGLPEAEQEEWLGQTERNGWSRNELRRRIRARRQPAEVAPVASIQMNVVDDRRRRWQEAAENAEQDLVPWMLTVLDAAAAATLEAACGAGGAENGSDLVRSLES